MAYVSGNPTTKKTLKELVKNGTVVRVYCPGLGTVPLNGTVYLEGPHYPKPHSWYAQGTMKDGKLVAIK